MGEKVRRIRLLVAAGVLGTAAFGAAWSSQAEVTKPPPLYLARDKAPGGSIPGRNTLIAVGDAPALAAHLLLDGEDIARLEVIDSAGRVVVLHPDGRVDPTGTSLDLKTTQGWVEESFAARARAVDQQVSGDPVGSRCGSAKRAALAWLELPTQAGARRLSFAETLAEADTRITAMHEPVNQIPLDCVPFPGHRAGYLHNLWHRITGL